MQNDSNVSKRDKKGLKIAAVIGAVLVIAAGVAAVWFGTADYRSYKSGVELLKNGDYTAAIEVFEALPDYKDSDERLNEAKYGQALEFMKEKQYLSAAESFDALGDYSDSSLKMSECYYSLAELECRSKNYQQAYDYFILAGDYDDSPFKAQKMIYSMGHAAFMEEDYSLAFECFERLEGSEEDFGLRHFKTLKDADEYLEQQLDDLNKNIYFYLGEKPEGSQPYEEYGDELGLIDIYTEIINYIPYHIGSASYSESEKKATVQVLTYYAGDVILDAWEKGDTSGLNEDQKAVLELALELVEQAKAETDSELELEIWLHDWICKKVRYDSPDMDVTTFEFMRLRELSCVGAMLDGKANCQGYTDAFYLLGNLAGFDVERVMGDAGGGHIWNTITLDGQQYIVDVTFDDINEDNYSGWTYTYFNVPWDEAVYSIDGGADTVPDIATEFALDKSYFGANECSFRSLKGAAEYLAKNKSDSFTRVVVLDRNISWDEFDKAMDSAVTSYGKYSSIIVWLEYYEDNTYITVCWE